MSDYSPPYSDADAKFENRRNRAVTKIRKMPAENLTVGNLLDIMEALGKYIHDMSEQDVKVVEKILNTHRMDHHCR